MLALLFSASSVKPQYARADDYVEGTTLLLVDDQGETNVTSTYSSEDGTVIGPIGELVPVVLDYSYGHIFDLNGNLIGYIE